uniref:Uncharacterized protein n=1 Tax=Plectus sambesii TaxID=2011161 RepID=A0A914WND1_9BILA
MLLKLLLFALILVIPATSYSYFDHHKHQRNDLTYREKWGYVKVRENANLFWWLYYTADSDRPLILWLQGGPGASSAGFGNFKEIGPLDTSLNPRNSTWVSSAVAGLCKNTRMLLLKRGLPQNIFEIIA